jgi:tryptophan synthase beta chain
MEAYFGEFGGRFVPELLMPPLLELEEATERLFADGSFTGELAGLLESYAGRPTPLTFCPRLSERVKADVYLKREDLLHTGAHKINNTLGQGLLARAIGKTRLVAETGAGQHGVATAVAAARLGLKAVVYMGATDVARQSVNVSRMRLLGAEVRSVEEGTRTLKDAINEALRDWIATHRDTHYCFGTAAGPHPFPTLVRILQSVIGREIKAQCLSAFGRLPDLVCAAVGGGSNAIGAFHEFIGDREVRLVGVEAAGTGEPGCWNSAPLSLGRPGILHGQLSMLLQSGDGQILPSHSVSAGLDYPGVGPEHSWLQSTGRAEYFMITDGEALGAFTELSRLEGIIPALESSHALAWAMKSGPSLPPGSKVVVNLSGRGDKDLGIAAERLGEGFAREPAAG